MSSAASLYKIFLIYSLASQTESQRQPRNITRADGESDVFIPCPFEFRATPSIWKINGKDYTAATIPSTFSITPGGLFINTVHVCLNQTSFQCIDTSNNALEEQVSDIGILTVTSENNCTAGAFELLFSNFNELSQLELDHRHIRYGSANTTLAWKIVPDSVRYNCSTSHILSYGECQQNDVTLNRTTEEETITISSASLRQQGRLNDFTLSSSSVSLLENCPYLMDRVRINVTATEIVNILLGNNNCTCVDVERREGLSFAISNPDTDLADIVCRVSGTGCYSPATCRNFKGSGVVPFFHVCDNPSENSHALCFANILNSSKILSGLRLDLFALKLTTCSSGQYYAAREYFRSFQLNVFKASASISVNTTSRDICFSSSYLNNCSLIRLTHYNISIADISGYEIFKATGIPESTCKTVNQLDLLPQCGPFNMSTQPFNDYIIYNLDVQQISSDDQLPGDEPELCTCLQASTQLTLAPIMYNSQDASVKVNGHCSTFYTTPVDIIIISADARSGIQFLATCSNGRFNHNIVSEDCDYEIILCGYFTFVNQSTPTNCRLNCSDPMWIPCSTGPTIDPGPSPGLSPGAIAGIVIAIVIIFLVPTIIIIIILSRKNTCNGARNNDSTSPSNTSALPQLPTGQSDRASAGNGGDSNTPVLDNTDDEAAL